MHMFQTMDYKIYIKDVNHENTVLVITDITLDFFPTRAFKMDHLEEGEMQLLSCPY